MAILSEIIHGETKSKRNTFVDPQLVRRCLRQDDVAWETVVRSCSGQVFRLCCRYTGRRDDAEDLTQEVLIRVYQNLHSYDAASGSFQNWVLRLSRNLIIDRYRKSKRYPRLDKSREIEELHLADQKLPDPHRCMERSEASRLLRRALRTLSPVSMKAIILRDLEGMGYQEMAETLGIPAGTVKSRLNRGRMALARQLSRRSLSSGLRSELGA